MEWPPPWPGKCWNSPNTFFCCAPTLNKRKRSSLYILEVWNENNSRLLLGLQTPILTSCPAQFALPPMLICCIVGSPCGFMHLFIYLRFYLFSWRRAEWGAGEGEEGGVYVIAVYTAFPRYYCLWLCFLFPSRVLISWSYWLAGRRVSGVKAERSLPGEIWAIWTILCFTFSPLLLLPNPLKFTAQGREKKCWLSNASHGRGTDFLLLEKEQLIESTKIGLERISHLCLTNLIFFFPLQKSPVSFCCG